MRAFIAVTKALADENRLRIIMALAGGERCVCEIIALLGLAPSTVSKHMAILHQAGLVDVRKDGRWRHYRLCGRGAPATVRSAIRWVRESLAEDSGVKKDARKIMKTTIPQALRACCEK
ncbi:MAG: ArsR/SmtB family transcription factor [Planctomycetota bacterium]